MLDHMGVQVADVEASTGFYTTVFGPIGVHVEAVYHGAPASS